MRVGELFISLGIKGAEKTIGAVGAIKDGLKAATSFSLETKAGLLGAGYALEQFLSKGTAQAQILTNMSNVLGVSAEQLEIFGNAAKHSGTSLDTVASSILTMQQALTGIKLGEASPKWFQFFAGRMGGLPDFEKLRTHPDEMIKRVQQFVDQEMKTTGDRGMINMVLQGLGLSAMAPSFFKGDFRPENLARGAKMARFSEGDLKSLDTMQQQIADISNTLEVSMGKLAAKFGPKLLKDIQKIIPEVTSLVSAFAQLSSQLHLIEGIGLIFKGWGLIFKDITTAVKEFTAALGTMPGNVPPAMAVIGALGSVGEKATDSNAPSTVTDEQKKRYANIFKGPAKQPENYFTLDGKPAPNSEYTNAAIGLVKFLMQELLPHGAAAATPNVPAGAAPPAAPSAATPGAAAGAPQASVTVHQNFAIGGDRNQKDIADAAARGLRSALIQNPILNQWA